MNSTAGSPDPYLSAAVAEFLPDVPITSVLPYGSGHIHKTYLVVTGPVHGYNYILQQINHVIFKDIPHVQENISRVTRHIRQKISAVPNSNMAREALRLIPAKSGSLYYKDNTGNYWRLYNYIEESHCFQQVPSPDIACEAGKAFGRFQRYLEDLKGPPLHVTIPDFHIMEKRLENFEHALKTGLRDRIQETHHEINFVKDRSASMRQFAANAIEKKIPVRITHNDTKINNVLFDEDNKALCVIDLDTVMPGYVFYDFGDAVRTITNATEEDESDLARVAFNMELFKAFTRGFLAEAGKSLTGEEISGLAFSCHYMTFIMGLRFLTDYLQGDWYYMINHEKHNLDRARVQFRLLEDMESHYLEMQQVTMN